ncbi:MAG: hypothetical protein ACFBZ8_10770 [Opitutales bacterium]
MRAEPAAADRFFPLTGFFQRRTEVFPHLSEVPAERLPAPARRLLDHTSDMTSALESYHGSTIEISLLHQHSEQPWWEREVVLVRRSDAVPVEYGAIAICLSALPEAAQVQVRAARKPFGGILKAFDIAYRSAPSAFFEGKAYGSMAEALKVAPGSETWGRCNCLSNKDAETLARIVEILPASAMDR